MGDPAADAARAAERARQSALQAEQSKVLELQRRVLLRQIYPPDVADCEWQRTKSKGLLNMLGDLLEDRKSDPCDAILAAYHRQQEQARRNTIARPQGRPPVPPWMFAMGVNSAGVDMAYVYCADVFAGREKVIPDRRRDCEIHYPRARSE